MTICKTVEDKVDNAVYAAFEALGLCVETNIYFAQSLNDWLMLHAPNHVTDDYDE